MKKKGYLKIHVEVNIKTKKILSIKVTDEHVHGNKAVRDLVENIIKSDGMTTTTTITAIGKLFADGAYMKVMIFLGIWETMESCLVSK